MTRSPAGGHPHLMIISTLDTFQSRSARFVVAHMTGTCPMTGEWCSARDRAPESPGDDLVAGAVRVLIRPARGRRAHPGERADRDHIRRCPAGAARAGRA